jgi:hypothetical protein
MLWIVMTVLSAMGLAVAGRAFIANGVIKARQFQVRGNDGKIRAVLTAHDDDYPRLQFIDAAGDASVIELGLDHEKPYLGFFVKHEPRMVTVLNRDGPELRMHDVAGRERVHLAIVRDAGSAREADEEKGVFPALFLSDSAGRHRLRLTARDRGPAVALRDKAGTNRLDIWAFENNQGIEQYDANHIARTNWAMWESTARLAFLGPRAERRMTLGWELDTVALKLFDDRESARCEMMFDGDEAALHLNDGAGTVRGRFSLAGEGSTELTLFDRHGQRRWSPSQTSP